MNAVASSSQRRQRSVARASPSSPSSSRPTSSPSRSHTGSMSSTSLLKSLPVLALLSLATIASLASTVEAAAFEPPGDQVLFGAWLDTQSGYHDTPSLFNQRLGYNVPVFQIAQDIPLPPYNYTTGAGGAAPESPIELSSTDAAVFLTVYPTLGYDVLTTADYQALAQQISDYHTINNRTVFLRYAPEMQGYWNVLYGMRPVEFKASWAVLHAAVTALAPETIFVWAPNTPQGYPYGQSFTQIPSSAADIAALDTNGDGTLDAADDAFSPYYPGDDLVDWIGISLYYKGSENSDIINAAQNSGYCSQAINGTNPATGDAISNWYQTYCAEKPTKACMFAESGAAWHVNDGGISQLTIQNNWINDCLTNTSMYDAFPRLKMVMQFEYEKVETSNANTQDLRDYRITNDTGVLAEFINDLSPMATRFSWANFRAKPTSISSAGAPPPQTNSAGSTVVEAITQTFRARPTTFPSLFGTTSDASQRAEVIQLVAIVVSGIAGALTVMKML
ncbi:hypothetical protein P7C70_g7244, partial [Phenoliferia sp. Uapishka_3]